MYALYYGQKGGALQIDGVGRLEAGVAKEVEPDQVNMLRHRRKVILFDTIDSLKDVIKSEVKKNDKPSVR